ncbi:hypothetical protein YYC_00226 [Plasmodium yoelii 17X]|uniref:PYST-C1-like N-terminal domain-containing protein n=1 Tax=Plasmodium yoelii 17X TaxID=1323249 RepID=V7PV71_PLAYE|nr:hypothetical protein YYC_00226 [Plasmodium yoelii 17X]
MIIPLYNRSKASDVGNKTFRGTRGITINNRKIYIDSKQETQLKNKNPKYDKGVGCFNIFKRDKKNQKSSYNYQRLPNVTLEYESAQRDVTPKSQEHLNSLLLLKEKLEKEPSNDKPSE